MTLVENISVRSMRHIRSNRLMTFVKGLQIILEWVMRTVSIRVLISIKAATIKSFNSVVG